MSACIRKCLLLDQQNVCWTKPKTAEKQTFSGEASTCAFHCRYIHMVNMRYIPDLIYFFQNELGWIKWTMAQNQKVYVEKCQLVAIGIFRFAAFLTRFSSVRGFIFRLFKKKLFFLLLRFHSPTLSVCDLLASSLKCKLLFSSHTKVLLFRPHITRKKPKTFSMNTYIYTLLRRCCCCCCRASVCCVMMFTEHHFCKQFIPLYLSFLKR